MPDELPRSESDCGSCSSNNYAADNSNSNNDASNNDDEDDDISLTLQEVQIASPANNDNVESYLPNMSSVTLDISNPYFVPMRRTSIDAIIESRDNNHNTDDDNSTNHVVKGDSMEENNSDVVKLTATKKNNTAVRRRRNNNNLNGLNLSSTSRDIDSLIGDASTSNLCSS